MNYLNLGCGSHYSTDSEWTNLDYHATGKGVIAHNLLAGIPFSDQHFDLVYHSHLLEHFTKKDGEKFIQECFRVLKPGGVIRIAIPDLERIIKNYLRILENGLTEDSEITRLNYEWILLELYDQAVRNYVGGNMLKYLHKPNLINEDFVFERLGEEAKTIRRNYLKSNDDIVFSKKQSKTFPKFSEVSILLKRKLKRYLMQKLKVQEVALGIGKFRLSGEIHQWMYDRYSLYHLLKDAGGQKIQVKSAFTSYISNWSNYEIDGKQGIVRKPDSLFIEAIK